MWAELVIDTFRRPREAARRLLALDLGADTVVQGALAVTCAGIVMSHVAGRIATGPLDPMTAALLANPLLAALVQLGLLMLSVVLTWKIGQLFGGQGGVEGAFRTIVWLNAVLLILQVAQLLVLGVAPAVAMVISVLGMGWVLWAFASFAAELHGFRSVFAVAAVSVIAGVVVLFGLMTVLVIAGITPQVTS